MTDNADVSTWPDGQEPRWWTLKEAAALYGVSVKTIRRRINAGTVVSQRDQSDPQSPYMVREDSLTEQFGEPAGLHEETPVEVQPPPALELKALLDDHREMLHELQRAHQAEAIAAAKAEHLGERVTEYRDERDEYRTERDRLIEENAELRHLRWWQRRKNR